MMLAAIETVTNAHAAGRASRHKSNVAAQAAAGDLRGASYQNVYLTFTCHAFK